MLPHALTELLFQSRRRPAAYFPPRIHAKGAGKTLVASLLVAFICLLQAVPARAGNQPAVEAEIEGLLENGGCIVTKDSEVLFSRQADTLLVPASTWKIATALLALETLGPDFRFETRFFLDEADNLYIQGFGDPYLISEEIALIMGQLKLRLDRIEDIVLVAGAFESAAAADGGGGSHNPYDAANGALAANFNTVNITVAANGAIRSAEEQTPPLPLMRELGRGLPPGTHRLNIGGSPATVLRHVGELFRALQEKTGVAGSGAIREGTVPAGLAPVYVHRGRRTLAEIVRGLMLYSNNFIANQVFLTCGARAAGYPATWDKAKAVLAAFLHDRIGLSEGEVRVEEGSGLSRHNRITPRAMLRLLAAFKPYAHLLPLDGDRLLKSGTLTGVYAYAGYFQGDSGPDEFVLILNQKRNHRDRLVDLLEGLHRDPASLLSRAQ